MGDIYRNPMYSDRNRQAVSQGFDSLARIFVPPDPQSVLAGAKAQSERQKQRAIEDFYRQSQDEGVPVEVLDNLGIIAGLYAPTQGYGARNMKDATDRRGQDIQSGDNRYKVGVESGDRRRGQDIESSDRRYKVDADGKVSVENNIRDNNRARDVAMLGPVAQGATRFVPPDIADLYKVGPTQTGVVEVKPGEKSVLPDGRVLEGNPKPKTLDEVKGDIVAGLSDEEKRAIGFGSTPVETVTGPDGKPRTVSRPHMLESGAPAVPKEPSQVYNWKTPDGARGGTAVLRDGKLFDSQSGQELPSGIAVQGAGAAQGRDGALGPTTANNTAANNKAAGLDVMEKTIGEYETLLKNNPGIIGLPGNIRGAAQNVVSVLQEFSAAFGNLAPEARISADQAQAIATKIGAGQRDPAIAQARVAQADLAYKWAQMQNPTGEVSRQAFERALETVSGGSLANNQSALEALAAMRQAVARERAGVNALRNPTASGPAGVTTLTTPAGTVTIRPKE